MRIKKILISGFKSYQAQEAFDDFHPRVNVIVGANGSGKSNLIFAIQFLLSNDFLKLRPEERKAILHQSGKENLVSGFVEIHFDNTDKRFPVDSQEVRLRRNVGITKADYTINGKHISSEDVMNLLESAGFSRSNPYYIVQQGKVQSLANITLAQRLELLREVAGTRVYDERREESQRILEDTKGKRTKIDEVLLFLDERLHELDKEKEELKEYQEQDRTRRALEYTIYNKELADLTKKLEALDASHDRDIKDMEELHKKSREYYQALKNAEKDLKTANTELEKLTKEKEFLHTELGELQKKKAQVDVRLTKSKDSATGETKKRKELKAELTKLQKTIETTKGQLDAASTAFTTAQQAEQAQEETIADLERKVQQLYNKQGRSAQFKDGKQRDAWLKKEIASFQETITSKKNQAKTVANEITQLENNIQQEKDNIKNKDKITREHQTKKDGLNDRFVALKEQRNKLADKRKELWQTESEIDAEIASVKSGIEKAQHQLYSTISKETAQGIESVKRIKKEHNLQGIYAPIIELFTCTEKEMTAIEVSSKGSLFNFVVDTDETASKVLKILNQEKAGRVTLMPLNRLAVKESQYPMTETTVPIIERLKFKAMFRKAFLHIFGRTILCSSIDEAATISKVHNLDCITIEGDQVSRKGALAGGFHDTRQSRLSLMNYIRTASTNLIELEKRHKENKAEIQETDAAVTNALNAIQQLEKERTQARDAFETFQQEAGTAQRRLIAMQTQLLQKQELQTELEMVIRQLTESSAALTAEIGTALTSKLSAAEEKELIQLNGSATEMKIKLVKLTEQRTRTQTEKTSLEAKLTESLYPKQQELETQISKLHGGVEEEIDVSFEDIERVLADAIARSNKNQEDLTKANDQIEKLKTSIDKLKEEEENCQKKLQDESKGMEKLLNSRSVLLQSKEEAQKKLREIGSLPAKIHQQYQGKALAQLTEQLTKAKKGLKAYAHVNKKALDQYVQFKEQREQLENRKAELEESHQAIEELITALDEKKDIAIQRTFRMVAKNFSQVFTELTGTGKAQMVMQNDDAGLQAGVDMKVSFSASGVTQRIHQLSGGQQSLVALAFIFAIQLCDKAPFYVFDEIDSALDDTYRLAIAQMIEKISADTQFIITTHRPEMLQHSNKCYKITYKNKVSNIVSCSEEDALKVLELEPVVEPREEGEQEEEVESEISMEED